MRFLLRARNYTLLTENGAIYSRGFPIFLFTFGPVPNCNRLPPPAQATGDGMPGRSGSGGRRAKTNARTPKKPRPSAILGAQSPTSVTPVCQSEPISPLCAY